jgi:hypothetical protein
MTSIGTGVDILLRGVRDLDPNTTVVSSTMSFSNEGVAVSLPVGLIVPFCEKAFRLANNRQIKMPATQVVLVNFRI